MQVLRDCDSNVVGATTLRNVDNFIRCRHSVTSQKTRVSCFAAVRTANLSLSLSLFFLPHAQEDLYARLNYQDVLRSF